MSDLISRADAIRVISGLDSSFAKYIEDLPSAQPEQKTCHGCIRADGWNDVCEHCSRLWADKYEEEQP